jgi:hypothetical protein
MAQWGLAACQNDFASLPLSLPGLANSSPDRAIYGRNDLRREKK